ncbi:hypothetical protein [Apilactobacillus micheneri]|uniref:hypothetical protein n=1 Tax=Apilactobacillus micheneri TaxID=1899430 RepID=UPI0015E83BD8|nr:hypothetical protein [Apilactobacillus micheneri]TPR50779.1 hypothetical protein DY126_06940 [Apilactobacillus micheneri]
MLTSTNADSVQSNTPNVSSASNENSDEGFDGGEYHLDFIGKDTYVSHILKNISMIIFLQKKELQRNMLHLKNHLMHIIVIIRVIMANLN